MTTTRVVTVTVDGRSTTVSSTDPARVTNVGTVGPAGEDGIIGSDGAPGTDGAPGADGDSAYEVAVANGFVGNEAAWLASLVGADGADGADGAGVVATVVAPLVLTGDELSFDDSGYEVAGAAAAAQAAAEATADAALDAHEAAANPHPGYLTPTEGNAAYDALGAATAAQAAAVQRANHTGTQAISTVTGLQTTLDDKAPLASPALTGNPTATTQSAGDNSTRLATTAYVDTASGLLVPKSLFDANTILAATTDDTPAALTVAASRFVGRKASGNIAAMTPAEAAAVLGSGTADATTFLRGDNTWAVPAGGGSGTLGTLGHAQAVADQSTITTIADLTGLTVTVTVASGRRIRITGFVASVITSVAATGFTLSIREGATQISQANFWLQSTAVGLSAIAQTVLTPSAGSHTYKLSLARATGTGVLGTQAAATYPAFILVEDVGT